MTLNELVAQYPLTVQRPLIVTEVTQMVGQVCVAAIDIHGRKIVRPLDADGTNWQLDPWYSGGTMAVGAILGVTPAPPAAAAHPHASEDFRLTGNVNVLGQVDETALHALCVETADNDVESIFGGHLAEHKYVAENSACRSLGCVLVDKDTVRPRVPFDKLRVSFRDSSGQWFDLPLTEMRTKTVGNPEAQRAALEQRLASYKGGEPLALRLGLTRPFAGFNQEYDPRRCILQLNGLVGVT